MDIYDFLVIGGGASGYFAAINTKEKAPHLKIGIIEKQGKVLQKVKVSGGGRCNVTNGETDPKILSKNYPRGADFLETAFQTFGSKDTYSWFEKRGVKLKTEKDGRVFPVSDSSQSIIDCFLRLAKGVDLFLKTRVENLERDGELWIIHCSDDSIFKAKRLLIATGSDSRIWSALHHLNFKIEPEVPSLFTFQIPEPELHELQGISFPNATVRAGKILQNGPLLITHWGLSGPAILKLSAWGAYALKEKDYHFDLEVNWLSEKDIKKVEADLKAKFAENPKKNVRMLPYGTLTQRFWNYICVRSGIGEFQKGAEAGKKQIAKLLENLTAAKYKVSGKSTFKEEFVTAGGVSLDEIHVETFASKQYPNLYFGGEVLNIDAITGGFNFQAAWTAGWIISSDVSKK
jgi:predicted Rossmann fold flavoprotein